MAYRITRTVLGMVLMLVILLGGCVGETPKQSVSNDDAMKITSSAFEHGANIPKKYSCDGENINPPLKITNAPNGTASFALIVDDPDAPSGTFVHWIVWNIAPETKEIAEGVLPQGALEGKNDFDNIGYGGPCPPSGPSHTYRFTLYALNQMLELKQGVTRFELDSALEGAVIADAELDGEYKR